MEGKSDFTPTTDLVNASPKLMITFFLLNECRLYSEAMRTPENYNINTMTADLLAYCPDVKKRDELYASFLKRKQDGEDDTTAALMVKAEFWAYICSVLEFTEKSTGGF